MNVQRLISMMSVLLAVIPVRAQIQNPFSLFHIGARAAGMQGATAATGQDYSVAFYNPASIGFIQNINFGFTHTSMSLHRTLDGLGVITPLSYRQVLGASFASYTIRNIEARQANTLRPDYLFTCYLRMGWLSYAFRLHRRMAIGVNAKFMSNRLDEVSASGTGVDIGILLRPDPQFRLAIIVHDLAASFRWDTQRREQISPLYRFSLAWYPFKNISIAGNINRIGARYSWAMGMELRLMSALMLRSGWDNHSFSAGGGLSVPVSSRVFVLLNYALTNDPVMNGENIHTFDLNVQLF